LRLLVPGISVQVIAPEEASPARRLRRRDRSAPRQRLPQFRQIVRQFALEHHLRAGLGVFESERRGMQRLAAQLLYGRARGFGQFRDLGFEPRAIGRGANQRMADMGHMHADLMGATGLKLAAQQRGDAVILDLLPMGDGFAAARFGRHGHFLALGRMSAEEGFNGSMGAIRNAPDESEIFARQGERAAMIGEKRRQPMIGGVGLGDDEQACRFLVGSMHDARSADAADARQARPSLGDPRLHSRAGLVAARWTVPRRSQLADQDRVWCL